MKQFLDSVLKNHIEPAIDVLFTPLRLLEYMVCVVALYCFTFLANWYTKAEGLKLPGDIPLGSDFLNVYTAGMLVNRGQAELAYNWDVHYQFEKTFLGFSIPYLGWHYPPPFLSIASLVASFPYTWAFAGYILISFAGYLLVVYNLSPRGRLFFWAAAAYPGVFINFICGQNGFITTTLMGAGFLGLERWPWCAGIMFGLLSYKPQFFVLIPLVLAIGGYGRALASTLLTSLLMIGLSCWAFGPKIWLAFIDASTTKTQHVLLENGSIGWQKMQSVFSFARMWGASVDVAYILQGFFAVIAIAIALRAWKRHASLEIRAAVMCGAIFLITPYFLDYDLVILAIPLVMLTRLAMHSGFLKFEKLILGVVWVLPLLARASSAYSIPLTLIVVMMMMGICCRRMSLSPSLEKSGQ